MTKLSVNINKIATLRNARGGHVPDVIQAAQDIVRFGAHGITVHPRPDERHIRYADVRELKKVLNVELNIEGNPREKKFIDLVLEVKPAQVTLVPDEIGALTSDHGWDTARHAVFLREMVWLFKSAGIRTSIFLDPNPEMVPSAAETGTDRIELYTEAYARQFPFNSEMAVTPYRQTCSAAVNHGLEINAGHDLNLDNLGFLIKNLERLDEVSIGHALIADALYLGLEETVKRYLACCIS